LLPPAPAIRTGRGVTRDSRVRTAGRTHVQPTARDGRDAQTSLSGRKCLPAQIHRMARLRGPAKTSHQGVPQAEPWKCKTVLEMRPRPRAVKSRTTMRLSTPMGVYTAIRATTSWQADADVRPLSNQAPAHADRGSTHGNDTLGDFACPPSSLRPRGLRNTRSDLALLTLEPVPKIPRATCPSHATSGPRSPKTLRATCPSHTTPGPQSPKSREQSTGYQIRRRAHREPLRGPVPKNPRANTGYHIRRRAHRAPLRGSAPKTPGASPGYQIRRRAHREPLWGSVPKSREPAPGSRS
jgi:hypothetical protein